MCNSHKLSQINKTNLAIHAISQDVLKANFLL